MLQFAIASYAYHTPIKHPSNTHSPISQCSYVYMFFLLAIQLMFRFISIIVGFSSFDSFINFRCTVLFVHRSCYFLFVLSVDLNSVTPTPCCYMYISPSIFTCYCAWEHSPGVACFWADAAAGPGSDFSPV